MSSLTKFATSKNEWFNYEGKIYVRETYSGYYFWYEYDPFTQKLTNLDGEVELSGETIMLKRKLECEYKNIHVI